MKLAVLARWSCTIALLIVSAPRPVSAAWPHNPGTNLLLCNATNEQVSPVTVSDGAGGAFVAWQDLRGGASYDIYAQHILSNGSVDPAWPVNGRAVCTAVANQLNPTIASDGAGGAIMTWSDARGGVSYDIYAQRILSTGVVAPGWPIDGRALCTATFNQSTPFPSSDGAGGAIVSWVDIRNGSNFDIYAQHVLSSGAVDPAWPVDGRALCTAVNDQTTLTIVPDGAAGAVVAWQDFRNGANFDIYAQHVLSTGAVDPVWPANGRAVCTAANGQDLPSLVSDGVGGALIAWQDLRSGNHDIYVHHVQANGNVDFSWPPDGRALCAIAGDQVNPMIVADDAGGGIVTWYDARSGGYDIYAQHVQSSGVPDPAWPANGRVLCAAVGDQYVPTIVPDGAGGAIVTWYDLRSGGTFDIYAQHVLSSGAVDPVWPADGRAISTASSDQYAPVIATDGGGGAIIAWRDYRAGGADIYAQRVARFGQLGTPEPEIASVRDVPNDQGGRVKLSWDASWLDTDPSQIVDHYWVFRSVPPGAAMERIAVGARVSASPRELDPADGALLAMPQSATTVYWEFVAYQQAYHILDGYSFIASTASDSVGGYNPRTLFMVVAWNGAGTQYWSSSPDSGYSVDNLGPATPAPFTGEYASGSTALHWNPNAEPDLAGYRLYRGTTAGFTPGPGNLVVAQSDTGFVDVTGAPYYYKLTAVDLHGNESPAALLQPSGTTDTPLAGAGEVAFAPPAPNPARSGVVLRITLPREARMSLAVYDVNGARVRTLAEGVRPAGDHPIAWDLRSERGARVPAGLYFARLEADGRTWVRRIAALD